MSSSLTIALLEDHASLRELTAGFLRKQGHRVFELGAAEDLDDVVGGVCVDIYIIDLNLPGEDGLQFAERIRGVQPHTGIIMLTARGGAEHIAEGYQRAADIYLIKPVVPYILLGAIKSIERRLASSRHWPETTKLDLTSLTLSGPRGSTDLSSVEACLLTGFIRSPDSRLDLAQLSILMGQKEDDLRQGSIEVRITRIRKKIALISGTKECIKNIRHVGYQLCVHIEIV